MKQNLFLTLFTTVLMTTSLAAQRSGRTGPDKMGGAQRSGTADEDTISLRDRCCPVIPPRRVLVRVLELNEDQLGAVAKLAEDIAAAVGPPREGLRAFSVELREDLGSEDPDPCTVGGLILDIKDLQAEICALTQSFADPFAEILDDDQREKWETIKDRFCNSRDRRRPGRDRPGRNDES